MFKDADLEEALTTLGQLLQDRDEAYDLVPLKLYAAADHWPDRSRHLADLRRLGPTPESLVAAARWCRTHDPSAGFREMLLLPVLAELGVEDPDV